MTVQEDESPKIMSLPYHTAHRVKRCSLSYGCYFLIHHILVKVILNSHVP